MTEDAPPGLSEVTVVVPVYRGLDDVRACLESVVRHTPASGVRARLLVIDDASPEPEVRAFLDEFGSGDHAMPVSVLHNPVNLGFVATVNHGFDRSEGDVVVLNADTVVTDGWLDRLAEAAGEPHVATVTPLTNFGSICTLPEEVIDHFELAGEAPRIDDAAEFVRDNGLGTRPEIITGVGFCMYVTRQALDLVGRFDEAAFGSGYGEEVDFCLRASRLGLRHLAEDSTFVYHHGGVSFGDERATGLQRSSTVLHHRYPFFRPANQQERKHDPLGLVFTSFSLGLRPRPGDRPHVLHLLHSPPDSLGGTEKHLATLMGALADDFDFSILYPVESGFILRTILDRGGELPEEQEFLLPGAARRVTQLSDPVAGEALAMALELFDFDAVHIQNLIGHSVAALDVLRDFDGPVICSVRDLYLACPSHSLLYRGREACGIPSDLTVCARCLPETANRELADLHAFRSAVEAGLDAVDHWVFASQSAADYFLRAYDVHDDRIVRIKHGSLVGHALEREPDETRILDEPLRLAFIGLGWTKKGLGVVNALADQLDRSSIELHHYGELKEPPSVHLQVHGPYHNEELPELLLEQGIQIVLLPGPYAETFGHVMTEALVTGLPVIGAKYGALGERIRSRGAGWTIDPADLVSVRALVENLDRCRLEVLRATRAAIAADVDTVAETAAAYARLYDGEATARQVEARVEARAR